MFYKTDIRIDIFFFYSKGLPWSYHNRALYSSSKRFYLEAVEIPFTLKVMTSETVILHCILGYLAKPTKALVHYTKIKPQSMNPYNS